MKTNIIQGKAEGFFRESADEELIAKFYTIAIEGMLNPNLFDSKKYSFEKIYVEFVVEKNGTISDVRLKNNLHPELDNQALNAIKKLKNWSPGVQNHHPVRVRMVLPINFIVR